MDNNIQDNRYEQLYDQLVERAEALHESNKRRIRRGIIFLLILPFVLGLILVVTGSDKIVFLIIWILIMFAVSAYLISVEYVDDSLQKTLTDVTQREADFDKLLTRPELTQGILRDRITARLAAISPENGAPETEKPAVPADTEKQAVLPAAESEDVK